MIKTLSTLLLIMGFGSAVLTMTPVRKKQKIYSPDKQYSFYLSNYLYATLLPCFDCGGDGIFYLYDEVEDKLLFAKHIEDVNNLEQWEWNAQEFYIKGGLAKKSYPLPRELNLVKTETKEEKNLEQDPKQSVLGYDHNYRSTKPEKAKDFLPIYEVFINELAFVSLSETYFANREAGVDLIDSVHLKAEHEDYQWATIEEKHRKLFYERIEAKETDSLYLYSYKIQKSTAYALKDLKMTAVLSDYIVQDPPYSEYEYHIGFEIDLEAVLRGIKYLRDFRIFACIADSDPFIHDNLEPIVWTKEDRSVIPEISDSSEMILNFFGPSFVDNYMFQKDGLSYYLQRYLAGGMYMHHFIIEGKGGKIFDKVFRGSEFQELSSLDTVKGDYSASSLWTGKLFKGEKPVIFGFTDVFVDCIPIYFLEEPTYVLYSNCDNRH